MASDGKGRLLIRKNLKEVDWVKTKSLSSQKYQCLHVSLLPGHPCLLPKRTFCPFLHCSTPPGIAELLFISTIYREIEWRSAS